MRNISDDPFGSVVIDTLLQQEIAGSIPARNKKIACTHMSAFIGLGVFYVGVY